MRAAIDLSSGQPRRRYSFKLLGTIASVGLHRRASAECRRHAGAVCRRCTGYRPTMGCGSDFYQIFPDRFARSLPREAEQDMSITIMQPDKRSSCVTGMNRHGAGGRINVLWRRSGRDKRKLPYLKKLGVTALYLNPVFKLPAYINTIPRIIAMSIRSLG